MLHIGCWDRIKDIDVEGKDITTPCEKYIKGFGESRIQGSGGDTNLRKSSVRPRCHTLASEAGWRRVYKAVGE
jgi:hypothetical protein